MSRRRLATPDQPAVVRLLLAAYEFCASLQFAVVLIALLAVVLGLGTFVESGFGTEAVKFGVWNTWWFTLLNALLAVSIFCAAAIRFPWKRHQTGFVITHIGLLVLLAGCLVSQRGGIDAQIPLLEGERGSRAYEDTHHFRIELESTPGGGREAIGPIEFRSGPFNWSEYGTTRSWFPWGLAPRDTGVIHDADGVRLEVLDFYADSTAALAPGVKLRLGTDAFDGAPGGRMWIPVNLSWQPDPLRATEVRHRQQAGGGTVVFWKAASAAEAEGFLAGVPDPAVGYGEKGQLVLVCDGQVHRLLVDDVLGKESFAPGGETGAAPLFVEVHDFQPRLSGVRVRVRRGRDGPAEEMVVLADLPEVTIHAPRSGVYGALWMEREVADAAERMQGKARSRIDVLQAKGLPASVAADRTADGFALLYRRWQAPTATAGVLPLDGRPVPAFAMPRAKLELRVDRFLPADDLEIATLPLPFDKDKVPSAKRRAAKVRLTVDGRAEEFWLAGMPIQPIEEPPGPAERRVVKASKRTAAITLLPDAIDVGFDIELENFERRLDPGTSQASHFSSIVEFRGKDGRPLVKDPVKITMNAPVDFSDPQTGRSYRLFQESFMGPWLPGDDLYERFTAEAREKPERLEASVLTVNHDPGRGTKYAGSGLIVIGIFTMFYMKAYFFGPRRR
jgi:hypothetical protein